MVRTGVQFFNLLNVLGLVPTTGAGSFNCISLTATRPVLFGQTRARGSGVRRARGTTRLWLFCFGVIVPVIENRAGAGRKQGRALTFAQGAGFSGKPHHCRPKDENVKQSDVLALHFRFLFCRPGHGAPAVEVGRASSALLSRVTVALPRPGAKPRPRSLRWGSSPKGSNQ